MTKQLIPALALCLLAPAGQAQSQPARVSPHETTSATIGGKKVTVEYGRPYKKNRPILGALVPYGQIWRTGADEATTIETAGDLMLGPLHVPAGKYSMFTIPGEKEWTLVINKVAKQSGAYEYDAKNDLGRVKMKLEKASAPVEQFTIAIESTSGSRGVLKMSWDTFVVSTPLMMH